MTTRVLIGAHMYLDDQIGKCKDLVASQGALGSKAGEALAQQQLDDLLDVRESLDLPWKLVLINSPSSFIKHSRHEVGGGGGGGVDGGDGSDVGSVHSDVFVSPLSPRTIFVRGGLVRHLQHHVDRRHRRIAAEPASTNFEDTGASAVDRVGGAAAAAASTVGLTENDADDVLAIAISREIAHILHNHNMTRSEKISNALITQLLFLSFIDPSGLLSFAFECLSFHIPYYKAREISQVLEAEADELGIKIVHMACFDPKNGVSTYDQLVRLSRSHAAVSTSVTSPASTSGSVLPPDEDEELEKAWEAMVLQEPPASKKLSSAISSALLALGVTVFSKMEIFQERVTNLLKTCEELSDKKRSAQECSSLQNDLDTAAKVFHQRRGKL